MNQQQPSSALPLRLPRIEACITYNDHFFRCFKYFSVPVEELHEGPLFTLKETRRESADVCVKKEQQQRRPPNVAPRFDQQRSYQKRKRQHGKSRNPTHYSEHYSTRLLALIRSYDTCPLEITPLPVQLYQ